jgi:NADH-quinone oxidoreductase subunit N
MIILQTFSSEIFLSLFILFQIIFNAYVVNDLKNNFPILEKEVFYQTFFVLLCILFLLCNSKVEGFFFNFLFFNNQGTSYLKIFILLSSIFILIPLIKSFKLQKLNFFEYFSLYLISILSLLLLINTCDLLSAYLTLEMQALTFYIFACFKRNSAFSTEAGLKYFIVGSFVSGIFLFGCSIVYGCLGTLNLHNLTLLFAFPFENKDFFFYNLVLIGSFLIVITFLLKLSVAPFHSWSPDVYEGAPLASTIIFSVLPKLALFSFFIKIMCVFSFLFNELNKLLLFCGLFTVFIGVLFAIRQKRVKRLMIFSSIAQIGFLIVALSVINFNNLVAIYFFLIIYMIASILMWSHISLFYTFQNKILVFYNKKQKPFYITNLSNLFKTNSLWALSICIIFFSIAGIPPFSGFFAKFLILFGLINSNEILGSFILIVISAVSTFYYLRILKVVFFEYKDKNLKIENMQIVFNSSFSFLNYLIISTLLFCLFFIFFYPSILLLLCNLIVLDIYFF